MSAEPVSTTDVENMLRELAVQHNAAVANGLVGRAKVIERRLEAAAQVGPSRCYFGRPHGWLTGAFYYPPGSADLYEGDDFVYCPTCGRVESDR